LDDPFDLAQPTAYAAWRAQKLAAYPACSADLRVTIRRLDRPDAAELAAIRDRVARYNMALVQVDPGQVAPAAILALTHALGLHRTDANLFADEDAVSHLCATPASAQPSAGQPKNSATRGDFIPYTNRPLSWHTDGYYNTEAAQVRAWTLFCARPAAVGGENQLLDHELAYIALRDASPEHIEALSDPKALTIPPHVQDGALIRPESAGPVFSVRDGHLHMRYSARSRQVIWRDDAATRAARAALSQLFSQASGFTFQLKLEAGQGIVSNNVLHGRSGFEDGSDPRRGRLLYRVRFLDRIPTPETVAALGRNVG
jgi:hypothetical protein